MTVWRTLGRLILVPLAFFVALAAAGFVLFTLGLERVTQYFGTAPVQDADPTVIWAMLSHGAVLFSAFSIVPALLFVIIGEVVRIRSLLYYMVAGGLALGAAPMIADFAATSQAALPPNALWQICATAGFFGGFVYWLIAGRGA